MRDFDPSHEPPPPPPDDDNIRRGTLPLSPPVYYNLTNDFEGSIAPLSQSDAGWLYHIFRERRAEAKGWHPAVIFSHLRFHAIMFFRMACAAVLLAAGALYPLLGIGLLIIFYIFNTVYQRLSHPATTTDNRVPWFAEDLFFRRRLHSQALLDLYFTGMTGRQIAEALLLETLEKTRMFLRTTYAFFAVALGLTLVTIAGWQSYAGMFTAIAYSLLAYMFIELIRILALQRCARLLELSIARWGGTFPETSQSGFFLMIYFAMITVTLVLRSVYMPLGFVVVIAALILLRIWGKRRYLQWWQELSNHFNITFSIFITSHLMQDDLGAAWSKWYYGTGRGDAANQPPTIITEESNEPSADTESPSPSIPTPPPLP